MSVRSFRLWVAALVVGALVIAVAAIARVAFGGTGIDGAMVIMWCLLAVAVLSGPVGWIVDRRQRRRSPRAREDQAEVEHSTRR